MRVCLVVLLIVYHSFCPFAGHWGALDNTPVVSPYFWIGQLSYSFFLEGFVFISGMLFGRQLNKQKASVFGPGYLYAKFKRLIVPSLIFSILYIVCFMDWDGVGDFVRQAVSGSGHLWFLPLLFWCFVGMWIVSKLNFHPYLTLALAVIIALSPYRVYGFYQIESAMHFLYFLHLDAWSNPDIFRVWSSRLGQR